MNKSQSGAPTVKSVSEGLQENQMVGNRGPPDPSIKLLDQDMFLCQRQIIDKMKKREIYNKSMTLLITAREKILLYNDHAEYARRKLKEARDAVYLMNIEDPDTAAEYEEKIQGAIRRLAKLEEEPLKPEDKTELSHRITDTEDTLRMLITQNDVLYDILKKKIAVLTQYRQSASVRRVQPLATRNAINDKN